MSLSDEEKGMKAVMIIEVIGRPPEHLVEALENTVKTIDEEKGVSVKEKKIKKPTLMKNKKDFYTSFAEVEVEVEEILHIAMLMFKYMPAHIDIISPEIIALSNNGWAEIFNELTRRLHGYDEVAKIIQIEKAVLEKRLRDILSTKPQKQEPGQETNPKKEK